MATNLVNDFAVKNRILAQNGALFKTGSTGYSINTDGRILSAGVDILTLFNASDEYVITNSPFWNSVYNSYNSASANIINFVASPEQGLLRFTRLDGTFFDVSTGLLSGSNVQFNTVTATTFYGNLSGTALYAAALSSTRTITFAGGDVTGSFSFNGASDVTNVVLTVEPNSVALGIDTTGAYVSAIQAVNGLSASVGGPDGSLIQIGHDTTGAPNLVFNNTNGTVMRNVSLVIDAFGHVVGATGEAYNLDNRYYTETEIDVFFTASGGSQAFTLLSQISATLVDDVTTGATQGQIAIRRVGSPSTTNINVNGLLPGSTPEFAGLVVSGNATVYGNLSVAGDFTYLNTQVSVTSALSIVNAGTGPALFVQQDGANAIAHFIDSNGDDIVFNDNGYVGLGTMTPNEKLTVVGGISATGDMTINGGVTFSSIPTGVGNNVVIEIGGVLYKRTLDSRIWGSTLVSTVGLSPSAIPVANDSNTLIDGYLSQTADNVRVLNDKGIQMGTTLGSTVRHTFTGTVGTASTPIVTYPMANLKTVKFTVSLSNNAGSAITSFEAMVTTDGSLAKGSVYAIVDNQAQSQMIDVDVSVDSGNLVLSITAYAAASVAIVDGVAFYRA